MEEQIQTGRQNNNILQSMSLNIKHQSLSQYVASLQPDEKKSLSNQQIASNSNFKQIQNDVMHEQLPVGKGAGASMSEYPQDYVHNQQQAQQIQPLEKRILTKVWKNRHKAYIQVRNHFQKGQLLDEYEKHLLTFISDSNVQAQEKGFKILELYIMKKQKITIDLQPIYKSLIEKGLISNRPEIVKTTHQIFIQLFGKGEPFSTGTIKIISESISNKNIKIIGGSIDAISPLLINFGLSRLQMLKPFLKQIEKLAQTNTNSIKNSIVNFFKEAYKWIGQPVLTYVNKLNKNIQDQLKKFTGTYEKVMMIPLRASESGANILSEKIKQIDSYALAESVNVIDKFDYKWAQQTLNIVKWSQKKQALDAAISAFNTPKILNKDHHHLIDMIERLLQDSNFNILLCSLKLLKNMANGLRKNFTKSAKNLYKQIFFKLRDKKIPIVEQTHKVLKAFLYCMTLQEMVDKIKQNLTDKAPNMRIQTLKFIQESVSKKSSKAIKQLLQSLRMCLEDATAQVRQKACQTLCVIKQIFGSAFLDKIDTWKNAPKALIHKIKIAKQPQNKEQQDQKKIFSKSVPKLNTQSIPSKVKTSLPSDLLPIKEISNLSIIPNKQILSNMKYYVNINNNDDQMRYEAYNDLRFNPNEIDFKILKEKALSESSVDILMLISKLIKSIYAGKQIGKQSLQFLMMHNWTQNERILNQLFKNISISQKNLYILKEKIDIYQSIKNGQSQQEMNPNTFINRLYVLSQQFKNRDHRQMALKQSLLLVKQHEKSDCTGNIELIGDIITNIKMLIVDKNNVIASDAIILTSDLITMFIITKTKGKNLIHTILNKFQYPQFQAPLSYFIDKSLSVHASFLLKQLFSILSPSISTYAQKSILTCLQANTEVLILTFSPKQIQSYLPKLMELMNYSKQNTSIIQQILDQVVKKYGQDFVGPYVRQRKNQSVSKQIKQKAQSLSTQIKIQPKFKRLQILINQRHIFKKPPTSSQTQKLLANFVALPEPLNELAHPVAITPKLIYQVFLPKYIQQYSDLLIQWIFWRFYIERANVVIQLVQASKRIMHNQLDEIQIIILLSGVLGTLELGEQVLDAVCSWAPLIQKQGFQKTAIVFYIESLTQNRKFTSQILYIIRKSFSNALSSEDLVTLLKIPQVKGNNSFIDFLKSIRGDLKAFGLQTQPIKNNGLQRIVDNQLSGFIQTLVSSSKIMSYDLIRDMIDKQMNSDKNKDYVFELHIRIIDRFCYEMMQHNVAIQICELYTKEVLELLLSFDLSMDQIARLLRVLVNLLSSVDNQTIQDRGRVVKVINNLLVSLLQKLKWQYLIEAIFIHLKHQELYGQSSMTLFLFLKCINRLNKNINYKGKQIDCYTILIDLTLQFISSTFVEYQTQERSVQKKLRQTILLFSDAASPHSININYDAYKKYSNNPNIALFMEPLLRNTPFDLSQKKIAQNAIQKMSILKCELDQIKTIPNIFSKEIVFPRGG